MFLRTSVVQQTSFNRTKMQICVFYKKKNQRISKKDNTSDSAVTANVPVQTFITNATSNQCKFKTASCL